MFCVQRFVFCVLYFEFRVPCFEFRVLCSVFCVFVALFRFQLPCLLIPHVLHLFNLPLTSYLVSS